MNFSQFPISGSPKLYRWTIADIVVIIVVIVFGIFCLRLNSFSSNVVQKALVFKHGERVATVTLDGEAEISLMKFGVNMVLETRDGGIRVLSSDCKQQICVRTGWITYPAEKIFCLPNAIIIELVGANSRYDIISY